MNPVFQIPSVLHGGNDDLNHALAHLSWKEMGLGVGLVLIVFIVIILIALVTQ